jgi:hypothetical protein
MWARMVSVQSPWKGSPKKAMSLLNDATNSSSSITSTVSKGHERPWFLLVMVSHHERQAQRVYRPTNAQARPTMQAFGSSSQSWMPTPIIIIPTAPATAIMQTRRHCLLPPHRNPERNGKSPGEEAPLPNWGDVTMPPATGFARGIASESSLRWPASAYGLELTGLAVAASREGAPDAGAVLGVSALHT